MRVRRWILISEPNHIWRMLACQHQMTWGYALLHGIERDIYSNMRSNPALIQEQQEQKSADMQGKFQFHGMGTIRPSDTKLNEKTLKS